MSSEYEWKTVFLLSRTAAGTTGAMTGTTVHEFASALRLVALAEGIEAVAESHHKVAVERVILRVFNIVGIDVAADVVALIEDVVDLYCEGKGLAAEELLGEGGIPYP